MIFENVAPVEVANKHLAGIYKMLGDAGCRDDVHWNGLSNDERLAFCRLAGFGDFGSNALASKALSDMKPDTAKCIIRAIKRLGQVARRFDAPCTVKYRSQTPAYSIAVINAKKYQPKEVAA